MTLTRDARPHSLLESREADPWDQDIMVPAWRYGFALTISGAG
jgi:hypothetical protein